MKKNKKNEVRNNFYILIEDKLSKFKKEKINNIEVKAKHNKIII